MAKLHPQQITSGDLNDYLNGDSDFAFEMTTLQLIKRLQFTCEHGGTYKDTVTGVARQFDIRARIKVGDTRYAMAIECKNVRENFPLLVSCVPRHRREARHDVLITFRPTSWPQRFMDPYPTCCLVKSVECGTCDPYRIGGTVGKACVQVGKAGKDEFQVVGKDIYERWSQSLSSAHELVARAANLRSPKLGYAVVLPVVVVPNGRLWQVDYDDNGVKLNAPAPTDRVSYYADHAVSLGAEHHWQEYRISHVEFVTEAGLVELVKWLVEESGRACLTPATELEGHYAQGWQAARQAAAADRGPQMPTPDFDLPDFDRITRELRKLKDAGDGGGGN